MHNIEIKSYLTKLKTNSKKRKEKRIKNFLSKGSFK